MAQQIQGYLKEQMPVWRETHPGVEEMRVAVMGCVVNGPGESKHADIGISLPGTFEEPVAPVFIDGRLDRTLRGDGLVAEFIDILEDYVAQRFPAPGAGRRLTRPSARRPLARSAQRRRSRSEPCTAAGSGRSAVTISESSRTNTSGVLELDGRCKRRRSRAPPKDDRDIHGQRDDELDDRADAADRRADEQACSMRSCSITTTIATPSRSRIAARIGARQHPAEDERDKADKDDFLEQLERRRRAPAMSAPLTVDRVPIDHRLVRCPRRA